MLVTEAVAATKFCSPAALIDTGGGPVSATDPTVVLVGRPTCVGSGCMSWRWAQGAGMAGLGYCGRAGRPFQVS